MKPDLQLGVCGEHGGDAESIALFADIGLDYVSCSPFRVPIARLAGAGTVERVRRNRDGVTVHDATDIASVVEVVDGNEAAARAAHLLSEVIAIYPITPASPMGELADTWSAAGRQNLWGVVPEVVEMQSEAGAAGTLHGAVTKGALGTTFTASQGLLLMIPNMFKIAGELTPAVIHVAGAGTDRDARAVDLRRPQRRHGRARGTGWAMLASGSVQEAADLAVVAHTASLESRVPVLHFFDGFRTSHELAKVHVPGAADIDAVLDDDWLTAHRLRGLDPDRPVLRGSAQNPDVFFQAREAANPFYDAAPAIMQHAMDRLRPASDARTTSSTTRAPPMPNASW